MCCLLHVYPHPFYMFVKDFVCTAARQCKKVMLKKGKMTLCHPLTDIFRSSLETGEVPEIFKMAFNKLTEIPVKALNPVQRSLKHLDLSGNNISLISDSLLNQIQNLVFLDLSFNSIYQIDEKAFCCSPALVELSLSHNPLRVVSTSLFEGKHKT